MKTSLAAAAALALTLGLLGCRTTHLGPQTGDAYREAIAAQRGSQAEEPSMSARDAKNALRVHRTGEAGKDGDGGSTPLISPSPLTGSGTSGSTGGKWQGASGNIELEAK